MMPAAISTPRQVDSLCEGRIEDDGEDGGKLLALSGVMLAIPPVSGAFRDGSDVSV